MSSISLDANKNSNYSVFMTEPVTAMNKISYNTQSASGFRNTFNVLKRQNLSKSINFHPETIKQFNLSRDEIHHYTNNTSPSSIR